MNTLDTNLMLFGITFIFWTLTFIFYFVGSGTNRVKAFIIEIALLTSLPVWMVLHVLSCQFLWSWNVDDALKPLFDQVPRRGW